MHLRPTTPLRDPNIVDKAIHYFLDNLTYTSLRSVHKMSESAYKQFELDGSQLTAIFSKDNNLDQLNNSRQTFPETYFPNGYVDILKTSFVLNEKLLHGHKVLGFITPYTVELDTYSDLDYLHYLMEANQT